MPDRVADNNVLEPPSSEIDRSIQIPGWQFDPQKATYTLDPQFLGQGHRILKVMPVVCDFSVMKGFEILGSPCVITHQKSAANPSNTTLPTIDQLLDVDFYHGIIMPQILSSAWHSQALGDALVQRLSQDCVGPIEIHPFVMNIFSVLDLAASFTYAVQPLGQQRGNNLALFYASVRPICNGQIDIRSRLTKGPIHGVAYVTHLSIPVDLSKYFSTPRDIENFNGIISRDPLALNLFELFMKDHLESIGNEVAEQRGTQVKGVILSPVTVHYMSSCSAAGISPDPQGELLVAATYLV